MPTYQYVCTECGDDFEVVQKFSDDALTNHDACGGKLRKVFSPVGIVFKGSGFYRTDSRGGSANSASATSNDKSDKSEKSGSTAGSTTSGGSASSNGSGGDSSTNKSDSTTKSGTSTPATAGSSSKVA